MQCLHEYVDLIENDVLILSHEVFNLICQNPENQSFPSNHSYVDVDFITFKILSYSIYYAHILKCAM